jgi:protein SCO1/2
MLVASLAGCRTREAGPPGRSYELRGRVVSVNRAVREAIVAHEAIPGFMDAMTMPFPIADDGVLAALGPGDRIAARLIVKETGYRLEGVTVTEKAAPGTAAPAPPAGSEPAAGRPLPDVPLVDQDGRAFRISEYRGAPLAITFIFTRCPLPDFCPRMLSHFAAVDRRLAEDPARARTRLLAVSFDPEHDTPPVLRAYGLRFLEGSRYERVRLATGEAQDVRALAGALGLEYEPDAAGQLTHNLRTAVVAPDGTLFRLLRGNDWTPETLLAELDASSARPAS